MSTRISFKPAIAFLLVAAVFVSAAAILDANDHASSKERLIVHEWGTLTSVSSADGKAQAWSPLSGPSELPEFVYRSPQLSAQGRCIKCELALVRMETPVLYFYTDRELAASVKVGFPQGQITEWYPQAREVNRGIHWDNFIVMPNAQVGFPVSKSQSHYYPARETDAAPIRLGDESKIEYEKFLFYRGIGNFELPVTAKLAGDQVTAHYAGQTDLAQIVLFENRGGRVGWRTLNSLKGDATLVRPELGQPVESLQRELEKILVAQGLYEKEAAAMVKTWRDSWFEEGLRVLYLVPRRQTDAILPITITPTPTELVRVLVGRTELITPEMERAVASSVKQYLEGSPESRAAAVRSIQPYGRFAQPVLYRMMEEVHKTGGPQASQPIWDFLTAASAR